ncbi:Haemolysin A [Syntrophomonas zehnderi OL-4]|uniref:Haemolysin A n=1 Tax=Syntrophomonas zehnderi OL-4 TaxID=690567 RepID=A0A0E4GAJ1_9FIRM|nr:TlyA family RNA methyltransferase [Syntrophomonas zehnderi]CFX49994.1 Haemolysin A [Syntrophomonas zehnderi OL-4]
MEKVRLDNLLFSKGLAGSREKARAMILAGEVYVDSQLIDKPGVKVNTAAVIDIKSSRLKYVSRGGYKLEGAIRDFKVDFCGKTVLDVGASTGGYTDCALQNQAAKVYAVDVGYGQLDWTLRNNPRVIVMERTNIRYLTRDQLGEKVDIITMDVSFISTTLIFPVLKELLREEGEIISLIKPQFEAGRNQVGKNGVVRNPAIHREVLLCCIAAAEQEGLNCVGVTFSPIKGPKGNIEYFIRLCQHKTGLHDIDEQISKVVSRAHNGLGDRIGEDFSGEK